MRKSKETQNYRNKSFQNMTKILLATFQHQPNRWSILSAVVHLRIHKDLKLKKSSLYK